MISILNMEFFRIKKNKLFWALFGVCAGLPIVTTLVYAVLIGFFNSVSDSNINASIWDLIRSSNVTTMSLSGVSSLMSDNVLLAIICASIFLSRDFACGTVRNMLLAQKSRLQIYLSHLTISITIGACYLGVNFVSTLLFSGSIFGFGSLTAVEAITGCLVAFAMGLVSVMFIQTLMCMFLFGTRKLAVALICPIVICSFAPSLLLAFFQMYDALNMISTGAASTMDLSWVPLYNSSLIDIAQLDGALIGKILMYNLPLTVFFGFMGWVRFRKVDLK